MVLFKLKGKNRNAKKKKSSKTKTIYANIHEKKSQGQIEILDKD